MRARLLWLIVCAASLAQGQPAVEDAVIAKLDATITRAGILEGTVVIRANGSVRASYLGSFPANSAGVPSPELFGRFLQIRQSESMPVVTDPGAPELPVEIRFRIREDNFLLPIHRQQPLQLDLLPIASPFMPLPNGGRPRIAAERYREEDRLEIPSDFMIQVPAPVREDRAYATYRSEAKIEDGRLLVVTELVLQRQALATVSDGERESFGKIIRADEEKPFVLRRVNRANLDAFVRSVSPFLANHYGVIAQQQREYDGARQLFLRALQVQPDDAYAWNNLGRALAALGDFEGAQQAYEKQISLNPKDRYAYNNLGIAQERQGRWDAAVETLRKQLEVHPDDSYAITNLPRALIQAHRWADAETAASRASATQPANVQYRVILAVARVCLGKVADPGREFEEAFGARPSAVSLNNAAYYLTECGKAPELAESYVRKALELVEAAPAPPGGGTMASAISRQHTMSTYLDTYGWLLFKQGNVDRAINLLTAAVTLDARAELYIHLAQAESKAGRPDLSLTHWREATFLEPGRLAQVPPGSIAQVQAAAPLSVEPSWYPLPADSLVSVNKELAAGQRAYFFLMADAGGNVTSAREVDSDDSVARKMLPAMRAIPFPVVEVEGRRMPTVQLVRVRRELDGKVFVERSLGTEAVAIAGELAPAEFPGPVTTVPPPGPGPGVSGVIPPRIVEKIEPRYSEEARISKLVGTVMLSCVVGPDGIPRDFKVQRSLGLGLDESAIRAVSAWRFSPGRKDGKPVHVASNVEVNFRLNPGQSMRSSWHLSLAQFEGLSGASRPAVVGTAAPRVAKIDNATATIAFEVDAAGAPVHLSVQQTSNDEWGTDVVNALSKWRFTPALRDGQPISVSGRMEFVRGN